MNETTKSWLVANFEIVLFWCVFIIGAIITVISGLIMDGPGNEFQARLMICGISALFLFALTVPTKTSLDGITKYILVILIGVALIIIYLHPELKMEGLGEHLIFLFPLLLYWGVCIAGSLLGRAMALYAHRNFQEVVSRRMLYRNSNVDLFEIKWKYVLDRFSNIAFSAIVCCFWLGFIIWVSFTEIKTDIN